jgi:hypothetical protein
MSAVQRDHASQRRGGGDVGLRGFIRSTPENTPMGEVIQERTYCTLNCGNCYRSPAFAPEARFFSCAACGSPAYECKRCVRVAREEDLEPATMCACCSILSEVAMDEDVS